MFLEVRASTRRVLVMRRVAVARRERVVPEQVPQERACMRVRARARVRVRVGNGFR